MLEEVQLGNHYSGIMDEYESSSVFKTAMMLIESDSKCEKLFKRGHSEEKVEILMFFFSILRSRIF